MYRRRPVAALLGLMLLVAACGGTDELGGSASTTSTTTPEPLRLPVQVPGQAYGHRSVPLTGMVNLTSSGCWTIELEDGVPRLVVFPAGFERPVDDPSAIEGSGVRVGDGTLIDGRGGVVPAAQFPEVPDGFWGNYLAFCDPSLQEFAVLDEVAPAFLPEALTDDELVTLLRQADFSADWGCGVGFAASDAAQHVAVLIHLQDTTRALQPPVSLPAEDWSAEVVVGKLLMSEWCNDAIESWVSMPQVLARWQLAGTLEFTAPPEGFLYNGAQVSAVLRGAEVTTPMGVIALGDLMLQNDSFGFFAG